MIHYTRPGEESGTSKQTISNKFPDDNQAAGTIKVNSQGYIRYITNESGHFQPTVSEALNYPQIFRDSGLIVDNAWIKVSEFITSMSNYVTDIKVFYNGPIQYMP